MNTYTYFKKEYKNIIRSQEIRSKQGNQRGLLIQKGGGAVFFGGCMCV